MRKLITVILILALLLPAAAMALDKEIDFYYGYAHIEILRDGSPVMYTIYFAEDQTCYFNVQAFYHDEPGIGRSHVGVWGYTADGEVFAKTGNNTDITFHINSSGALVDKETMQVYEPISALFK
jgi:hypothetical protein